MKLFACAILALFVAGLAGCTSDTPAYSAKERFAQIHRNQDYESRQLNDDIDHILLARPDTQLTVWNVYHRD
jgi:hypothetical protein